MKAQSPKRRRKLWWLVVALLLFMACGAAFMGWASYYGTRALRDAIAETTKSDPHWLMHDIEARRIAIPDSENSALVVQAGKRLCPGDTYLSQHFDAIEDLGEYPDSVANEGQKLALADYLKLYSAALVEYRKLTDMSRGRFPITLSPDIVSTPNSHIMDVREACVALRYLAYERIDANDANGAADAIIAAFNSARSIGDEPFWNSIKVRIFCDAIPTGACERFLAQTEANDATLARIQSVVESELREPLFLQAMRGQRAFCFAGYEYVRQHPIQSRLQGRMQGAWGSHKIDWIIFLPGSIDQGQAEMLLHMNDAVRIAARPYEEHLDAFIAWDQKTNTLSEVAQQLAPSGERLSQEFLRHQAHLRCLQVAIAAERFRQQHQKWPDALADLVAKKLIATVPLDPFDGKPLRWKTVINGRVIYSIGKNRVDDGGNFQRVIVNNEDHSDVGFRLYDPDKRRQPPRSVKAKEGESKNVPEAESRPEP
jgi:hypothetical protein